MKLWMSDRDICDMYRGALNSQKQIKILAQLNDCKEGDIMAVLERNGINISEACKTRKHSGKVKCWTVPEIIKLLYLAESGASNRRLAEVFGRNETSIKCKLSAIKHKPSAADLKAINIFSRAGGQLNDQKALQTDTV